jgi:hypothetical protein
VQTPLQLSGVDPEHAAPSPEASLPPSLAVPELELELELVVPPSLPPVPVLELVVELELELVDPPVPPVPPALPVLVAPVPLLLPPQPIAAPCSEIAATASVSHERRFIRLLLLRSPRATRARRKEAEPMSCPQR